MRNKCSVIYFSIINFTLRYLYVYAVRMRKDRFDLVKKAITSRPDAYKNPQRVGNNLQTTSNS